MNFRICRNLFSAALLAAVVAMPAYAQEGGGRRGPGGQGGPGGPGGPGGRFGGGMGMMGGAMSGDMMLLGLLRVEEVQKEVDLMPDQIEALGKIGESMRPQGPPGGGANFREMSEEERNKFMEEMRKTMEENAKKVSGQLEEVLLPEQLDRVREIALQAQGANALLDAKVIEKLVINADQKKKLEDIQASMREKMGAAMREAFESGDREAIGAKMNEMRKSVMDESKAVLTDEQKKTFDEMLGKPFDLPAGAMMGGRGMGRGPGQGGPGQGGPGRGGPGGGRQRGGDRGGNDA
jgi:hypothetical protein